jgi:hypothetical protein
LNTTLTPHSIIHGDACLAYFNKIWGIPTADLDTGQVVYQLAAQRGIPPNDFTNTTFTGAIAESW